MVQANHLSPDHGRPTFFVSPTGVENFPPLDFGAKDERPRWRREVDADATCFAGGPVEACVAREAFARRATLLRDLLDATDAGAPAARCTRAGLHVPATACRGRARPQAKSCRRAKLITTLMDAPVEENPMNVVDISQPETANRAQPELRHSLTSPAAPAPPVAW